MNLLPYFARIFALVLVVTAGAGCLGTKYTWRAQPVATADVRVAPQEVYRRKNRLFVRVTLTNLSEGPLTVDRDLVALEVDDGRTMGRSVGLTSQHKPYVIAPGRGHSIYVDFLDEAILDAESVKVVWTGAVFDAANKPVAIPPTPATFNRR